MLEGLGATVRLAGNGREVLQMVTVDAPDLVLCDLRMPGMDGFAVLAALRALPASQGIRVVAITGYASQADIERTRAAGFDGHVVKPIDYDALVAAVGRGLGRPSTAG